MKLTDIPPEILVAGSAQSHLAIPLYLCGSVTLNRKLLHSVTNIDLLDARACSKSRYPKLLSSFPHLVSVGVNRGKVPLFGSAEALAAELMNLPRSSLEQLTLPFLDFFADIALPLPLASCSLSSLGPKPLLHHFTALTTLELVQQQLLELEHARALPPTLTCLTTPTQEVAHDLPLFRALPRGLLIWRTTLSMSWFPYDEAIPEFFQDPPPAIHTIGAIEMYFTESQLEFLPPTLVTCNFIQLDPGFIEDSLSNLPSTLEYCFLRNISYDWIVSKGSDWAAGWPKRIRNLGITKHSAFPIPEDQERGDRLAISNLPQFLQSLSLETSGMAASWNIVGAKNLWPKTLDSLVLAGCGPEALEELPQNLTSLELVGWTPNELNSTRLPKNLSRLVLDSVIASSFSITSNLPAGVSYLAITPAKPDFLVTLPSLPKFLRYLNLWNCKLDAESATLMLPSTLQTLILGELRFSQFGAVPRSLTELRVGHIPLSVNAMIPQNSDVFEELPSTLRVLELASKMADCGTCWSHLSFSSLSSLESICVNRLGYFDPRILGRLSPKLRRIQMDIAPGAHILQTFWISADIRNSETNEHVLVKGEFLALYGLEDAQ